MTIGNTHYGLSQENRPNHVPELVTTVVPFSESVSGVIHNRVPIHNIFREGMSTNINLITQDAHKPFIGRSTQPPLE